ncbi:MAG: alanyl-tRNA editing protein [Chloroflexi bacterium]|nr:MAG: alanyl-tRNA editing protein [Chloroflexota bacterium]
MTELLYLTDSYLREFEATVTQSKDNAVVLDRTAFYPGGGGQPADTGILSTSEKTWHVTRVQRDGGDVWHYLDSEAPAVGVHVVGRLDWGRRYQLMRTHTALHILCGVVWRDYGALVTGGNMKPGEGRMDFEFERMQKELVQEIEEKINAEVRAARDIEVAILPREEAFQIPDLIRTKINLLPASIQEVRTVHIKGLDLQADGGTHVANTSEVGPIKVIKYESKGRINKRIYIALADET